MIPWFDRYDCFIKAHSLSPVSLAWAQGRYNQSLPRCELCRTGSRLKIVPFINESTFNLYFLGFLKQLESLKMSTNHLSKITSKISNLTNLHTLHLSSNYLKHIPSGIIQCSKLSDLRLNQNLFTEIPHALLLLPELRCLNMVKNHLKCLPMVPTKSDLRLVFDHNLELNHLPYHLACKLALKLSLIHI